MIDRATIERMLADYREVERLWDLRNADRSEITEIEFARRHSAWLAAKRSLERAWPPGAQIDIQVGCLALLAIVEALAVSKPGGEGQRSWPKCEYCNAGLYGHGLDDHRSECLHRQARELLAPSDATEAAR